MIYVFIKRIIYKNSLVSDWRSGEAVSARPAMKKWLGDEDWQLSKDSADAATAPCCNMKSAGVSRQRESKKRNQDRNRGSLVTMLHMISLLFLGREAV